MVSASERLEKLEKLEKPERECHVSMVTRCGNSAPGLARFDILSSLLPAAQRQRALHFSKPKSSPRNVQDWSGGDDNTSSPPPPLRLHRKGCLAPFSLSLSAFFGKSSVKAGLSDALNSRRSTPFDGKLANLMSILTNCVILDITNTMSLMRHTLISLFASTPLNDFGYFSF